MSANGDEINRREVAWRLFASEFRDADFSYAESDEERAPNYVVTPTGARVNRLFVVGVLTEVEYVSDDYLRARIVDPTGAFVVYAGQYQPEALTFLESADTPMFVAVTGKARTFQPDDSDIVYTSIRPESISEVEAATRDNWVVTTAQQTLERVATMADALELVERGDDLRAVLDARHVPEGLAAGIPLAIDHYGTTEHYLAAVRDLALDAARVVAGDREEVRQHTVDPSDEAEEPVALGLDDFTLTTGDAQPVSTGEAPETTETEEATATDDATATDEPTATAETGETEDMDSVEDSITSADAEVDEPEADAETDSESPTEHEAEAATVGSSVTESTSSEPVEAESAPDTTATTDDADSAEPGDSVEPESDSAAENVETDAGEADDDEADAGEAEAVDTDEMYELSEEERKEVEENYDVGFSTADEIEGEAGIEPEAPQPDAEPADDAEPDSVDDADDAADEDLAFESDQTEAVSDEPAPDSDEADEAAAAEFEAEHEDAEPSDEDAEGTTTENLEDVVVETMQALGDGAGADRDELIEAVMEDHEVDQAAVEDAIQDALMSGRCYESGENELTAI